MLTRQTRKTIDAIMDPNTEKVPRQWAINMMESLDFIRKDTGDHMIWRHPNGTRFILPYNRKTKDIWGFRLKALRTLITDLKLIEEASTQIVEADKEDTMVTEIKQNRFNSQDELRQHLEKEASLSSVQVQQALKAVSDAFNQQTETFKRVLTGIQSVQDFLIELGVKLDAISVGPAPKPKKQKMTPEELKAFRSEHFKGVQKQIEANKRAVTIKSIQEAMKTYPHLANDPRKLAVMAGCAEVTLKKYKKEGWV